jgi:hypothetical protein
MRMDIGVVDEPSGDRIARLIADKSGVQTWVQDGPREGTVYIMAACTSREQPVLLEEVRAAI